LHFRNAISICAATVLATVFSVQQGEHGPLVVYKLAVPQAPAPVTPARPDQPLPTPLFPPEAFIGTTAPAPTPAPAAVAVSPSAAPAIAPSVPPGLPSSYRPGPLQPTILGTVVLPAGTALPALPPAPPAAPPAAVQLIVPDYAPGYRIVSDSALEEAMVNEHTGEALTLDEVHDAITWRRDTVEKLRDVPIAPRF
jgi:hypothetical protein